MHRKIVPDVIEKQTIHSLSGTSTALDAAKEMAQRHVAAILIVDDSGTLEGIVTERDLTQRVMAKGLSPEETKLKDFMTSNPDTLTPNDTAGDALDIMRRKRFRHLPVVDNGDVVGMVSVRDLYSAVQADLEAEIKETEAFVFGDRYTAGS